MHPPPCRVNSAVVPPPLAIDHQALFADVVAVAKTAHAPNAGWRAICVRAQRQLGKKVVQPLAEIDLEDDLTTLRGRVKSIVKRAPSTIDTLVFYMFDGVDEAASGAFTGYHVCGIGGFDPSARWLLSKASWVPEDRYLESRALDAIARAAGGALGEAKKATRHALRFGAAALLSRFAAEGLPYRVVVAFDDGDFAEVSPGITELAL